MHDNDGLDELRRFVAGAEGWTITGSGTETRAVFFIAVSPECGWVLSLSPSGSDPGQWTAGLMREFASAYIRTRQGTFDACRGWAEREARTLTTRHRAVYDIHDLTDCRTGWRFHDNSSDDTKIYAGRAFDYGKHGQVRLAIMLNDLRHAPLQAQVSLPCSAVPEASCTGPVGDIAPWVDDWERCLALPLRLAECKTDAGGREMAAKASRAHLGSLAYLLEIDGTQDEIRRWLLNTFVPTPVRSRG
jgi:hypothetical protein